MLKSFIEGMNAAIEYKNSLAQRVADMFGYEVLKSHVITFEGISKTGHRINIPITEDMLNHAEHTHQRMRKKKPTGQRLPAFKVRKNK